TQLMNRLRTNPDSILVSAETVTDFQLHPGDLLNLRLQNGRTKNTVTVPFHYAGVVTEFPTAPKDSFFVANASYVARTTGSDAVGSFLLDTGGQHSTAVADRARHLLGPSAKVTDIADVRTKVGSSLTSVDLAGLTRVELAFALVLAAGAGGLVLALGLAERRRGFAVARALGATRRQLRVFIAGETSAVIVGGVLAGGALGWWLTQMLVTVLTGVFDPPPAALAVPWVYLAGLAVTIVVALGAAAAVTGRIVGKDTISAFRDI
ncbi:MAG: FtsX-like permease family protein, partial [Sciscionella sp.]